MVSEINLDEINLINSENSSVLFDLCLVLTEILNYGSGF